LESRLERWSGQRDCLRVAVWTGDLGFVKVGACVGLCISVAVWTSWSLVLVFTLAEEDVVVSFGGTVERGGLFAQKPKLNLDLMPLIEYGKRVK
jgi:hypothetical protein